MNKHHITSPARESGKQYRMFLSYLAKVRSGKTGLIVSTDYVVMDRKTYDKLMTSH